MSERVTTVGKKSLPGINATAEATAPYGQRGGPAAGWWEAARSMRVLLKEYSQVIVHEMPKWGCMLQMLSIGKNRHKKITEPATHFGSCLSQKHLPIFG